MSRVLGVIVFTAQKMAAGSRTSLEEERNFLTRNRQVIVDNLEADDVIDELIQSCVLGTNAAQRVPTGRS